MKNSTSIIDSLTEIAGEKNLITLEAQMLDYSHDEFVDKNLSQIPVAVVKPENTAQVSSIIKWADKNKIPVTARGGGTGLCGGCVPSKGGIVLSLEHMNKIVEIDLNNQMAVVEAGVRLMDFYKEVENQGLFFPPHPGDETAVIGGVIATNAGGARAVKYGVVRNFIKGLEVVLADGSIVNLGGKILKNSTGYSLLHLMIGSEGTLGIITKAIINLIPPPKSQMTLIAPFDDLQSAVQVVPRLSKAGILPMAAEFIEFDAMRAAEDFTHKKWPCRGGQAHLMIIVDGSSDEEVLKIAEEIERLCSEFGVTDVFVAETKAQQKEILEMRSHLYETLKNYIIEVLDIVMPPSELPGHVQAVHALGKKYNMWLPTFGHVSDGNVHTHIMRARYINGAWREMPDDVWKKAYPGLRKALHADAKSRGGLVSGEHGIGTLKKEYLKDAVGERSLELMRKIKQAFDPNNILNPGKII
ncbi:MAG: FAD-binding oxidoreductase [bacterium]